MDWAVGIARFDQANFRIARRFDRELNALGEQSAQSIESDIGCIFLLHADDMIAAIHMMRFSGHT